MSLQVSVVSLITNQNGVPLELHKDKSHRRPPNFVDHRQFKDSLVCCKVSRRDSVYGELFYPLWI